MPAMAGAPDEFPRIRLGLVLGLGSLSAFGPLSMDLYLPALPRLADDLGVSDAVGQLTMSLCMIGLALGQLLAGPLSDRLGRHRPLVGGVALFALTSLLCAVAPGIASLLVLRFLNGLAGGAGIVIARAMVRDRSSGVEAARLFSLLMLVTGAAPVLAPLLGSQLLHVTDWRGVFVALGAIGAALTVVAWRMPETLPLRRRHGGGLAALRGGLGRVLSDGRTLAAIGAVAFGTCGMFTYISLGSFVFEEGYGLSPTAYAALFAVNAVSIVALGQVGAVLVRRTGPLRLLAAGVAVALVGALGVLVLVLADAPVGAVLVPLLLVVAPVGLIAPNGTAIALERHARDAGTASAVLGLLHFGVGALIPPLASSGGTSATVMAWTMVAVVAVACVAVAGVAATGRRTVAA